MRTGTAAGVRTLLGVVVLLFGLLAMHGLASEHHRPALPSVPVAGAPGEHGQHPQAALMAGLAAGADAAAPCDSDCTHQLVALCLAVLATGVAGLAVLLSSRARPLPQHAVQHAVLPDPGPPVHLRRPDPVRDLCISRT